MLGLVLTWVFNRNLVPQLNALGAPVEVQQEVISQKDKLAAIETSDARGRQAVNLAFVAGFRTVALIAATLGVASSLSAVLLIRNESSHHKKP
jgi:hypothetical protein